jgi:hypothetical protein
MEILTLSNGKKVANFSSPHQFIFTDGSILHPVPNEVADKLKVDFTETDLGNGDVKLDFGLSTHVWEEMMKWKEKWALGMVHTVYVPLPMLQALHKFEYDVKNSPFRTIRTNDRINKLVCIDKQCI